MRVKVLETIVTNRGSIPPGRIVDIPVTIIDQLSGKIQPLPFDPKYYSHRIEKVVDEIGTSDPSGNCWNWVKRYQPELWQHHKAAIMSVNSAYNCQDIKLVELELDVFVRTFHAMLNAWNCRHECVQQTLIQ